MGAKFLVNNMVGGLITPAVDERIELELIKKSVSEAMNFIIHPEGGAGFRTGTNFSSFVPGNQKAFLYPFKFNDSQAYNLAFVDKRMYVLKDNGVVLNAAKTIVSITVGATTTIEVTGHGYTEGDQVYITGTGIALLDGQFFDATSVATNTFVVKDVFGNHINTTGESYSSGGEASQTYYMVSPYHADHIERIQMDSTADTAKVVHGNYHPKNLTRTAHNAWTIADIVFTPSTKFTPAAKTITGITQAAQGVVTATSHGFENEELVYLQSIVGMTQLNDTFVFVSDKTTNTFKIKDKNGDYINTTGYTAYSSGGTATTVHEYPRAVRFVDGGRVMYAGARKFPATVFGSMSPTSGTLNYDNFTLGTAATDAYEYTLDTFEGESAVIQWLSRTTKEIIIGNIGDIRRMYGATIDEAVSPTSINIKPINSFGVSASIPISTGASFFYIQDNLTAIRNLEFDFNANDFLTTDRNLVTKHRTKNGFRAGVFVKGRPDLFWYSMQDGRLFGLTHYQKEDITAWHSHFLGGKFTDEGGATYNRAKVISLQKMYMPASNERLWFVVERVINGKTVYSFEYLSEEVTYPEPFDFYEGVDEDAEKTKYNNVMFEVTKKANHLDMASSYDGSDSAVTPVTPGAVSGSSVTFVADSAIFLSSHVGKEIWKKYKGNGSGGGKAVITGYTSSTQVTCEITIPFDNTDKIAAGDWMLSTDELTGLGYAEGESLSVVADGAYIGEYTVTDGALTFANQYSYITVGYKYFGLIRTLNLVGQFADGIKLVNARKVNSAWVSFRNSLGLEVGTNDYDLEKIEFASTSDIFGRPPNLFNGRKKVVIPDDWRSENKEITVRQMTPKPCYLKSIAYDLIVGGDL